MASDVVVVGAGAHGLAAARELARAGHRPLVLERASLAHTRGSSHGTSRIVRLAHDRPEDVVEAIEAYEGWDRLERDTGVTMRITVGGLDFGAFVEPTVAALAAHGVSCELLEAADVERRFPEITARGASALLQPDAAIGLADVALRAIADDAVRRGAQLRERTPVASIVPHDDRVVVQLTAGEAIEAGCVVLAAGGWIGGLAAGAGVDLPARPTLQAAVHIALRDAPVGAVPTVVEQDTAGRIFYCVPSPHGGEIKGGLHLPGPAVELDGSRKIDDELAAPFREWAAGRYRGLGDQTDAYGCIYTWLPDDRFHLARHGRLVVVSCCSGRGFKFTPRIGALAAALADEALAG